MLKLLLFFIPFLTAFTAWATAWVLIGLVIYPLRPRRILGVTVQGFLIAHQDEIATTVAGEVASQIGSGKIKAIDQRAMDNLRPVIEQHLDTFLRVKIKEKLPVIATFIGESTIVKLKEGMLEEIEILLPEVITRYTSTLSTDPTVTGKISGMIASYPPAAIEEMLGPKLTSVRQKVPVIFAFAGLIMGIIISLLALWLHPVV